MENEPNRICRVRAIEGKENLPIVNVTHEMARNFCTWVSMQASTPVYLPGEIEWEYAARGKNSRDYPWGNQWDPTRCVSNQEGPSDVGSLPGGVSWCGAMDMAGNVYEWCADRFEEQRYRSLPERDPPVLKPTGDAEFVIRGGAFINGALKFFLLKSGYKISFIYHIHR